MMNYNAANPRLISLVSVTGAQGERVGCELLPEHWQERRGGAPAACPMCLSPHARLLLLGMQVRKTTLGCAMLHGKACSENRLP